MTKFNDADADDNHARTILFFSAKQGAKMHNIKIQTIGCKGLNRVAGGNFNSREHQKL